MTKGKGGACRATGALPPLYTFLLLSLIGITNCASTPKPPSSSSSSLTSSSISTTASPAGSLRKTNDRSRDDYSIPGLYNRSINLIPIRGQRQFDDLIYHQNHARVSVVQFYMATCPDCQGFSPYFKRLVSSLGPRWEGIVNFYVVNCNDEENIELCWSADPKLIVPLVRVYAFPQFSEIVKRASQKDLNRCNLQNSYKVDMISMSHRNYTYKQRRDYISLRQMILDFPQELLKSIKTKRDPKQGSSRAAIDDDAEAKLNGDELVKLNTSSSSLDRRQTNDDMLTSFSNNPTSNNNTGSTSPIERKTYDCQTLERKFTEMKIELKSFPVYDNLYRPVSLEGHTSPGIKRNLIAQIEERRMRCDLHWRHLTKNFRDSKEENIVHIFVVIEPKTHPSFIGSNLIFDWSDYTCNGGPWGELSESVMILKSYDPILFGSVTINVEHRLPALIYLGDLLVSNSIQDIDSIRLIATNGTLFEQILDSKKPTEADLGWKDTANANWVPEKVHHYEETLRAKFSEAIDNITRFSNSLEESQSLFGIKPVSTSFIPVLDKGDKSMPIDPAIEDKTLLTLTDYYKALQGIVDKALVSRDKLDGHQLLGSICLLKHLADYFPYQGNVTRIKSKSRRYIRELDVRMTKLLRQAGYSKEICTNIEKTLDKSTHANLAKFSVPASAIKQAAKDIRAEFDIGLPIESKLKYSYCQPSDPNSAARGFTCSLWLLFHTLTVAQYEDELAKFKNGQSRSSLSNGDIETITIEESNEPYEFQLSSYNITRSYFHSESHSSSSSSSSSSNNESSGSSESRRRRRRRRQADETTMKPATIKKSADDATGSKSISNEETESTAQPADNKKTIKLDDKISTVRPNKETSAKPPEKIPAKSTEKVSPRKTNDTSARPASSAEKGKETYKNQMETEFGKPDKIALNKTDKVAKPLAPRVMGDDNKHRQTDDALQRYDCDGDTLETSFHEASNEILFSDAPGSVLSSIINFVRYFLPCTNCAAHFSCMVSKTKPSLRIGDKNVRSKLRLAERNLLWLWEAHNRVNLRTRKTHSEDPIHPKHVFPAYKACPDCYLEKPNKASGEIEDGELDSLKFNKPALIGFLVKRYKKSKILNNKVRIEDLYK